MAETMLSLTNAGILLVGCERMGEAAIRALFEREGYAVLAAKNLATAVTMLEQCPVDLLITHPYVVELPGQEAIQYLRTKRPGIPALMIAGLMHDDLVQNAADLDHFEIFPPLFPAALFIQKVREILKTSATGPSSPK